MKRTRVVNLRKEPHTKYIGRGSFWGNPFPITSNCSREEVIEKYRAYIKDRPYMLDQLHELEGHVLGCYCKPLACHGDVLIELLKEREELKNENKNNKP